jgi:hypothetical protein
MFRPFFRTLLLRNWADASAHRAKRGDRSINTLYPTVLLEAAGGHPASFVAYWFVACALLAPVPPLVPLAAELPLYAIEGKWPYNLQERVSKEVVAHENVREGAKAGLLAPGWRAKARLRSRYHQGDRVGVRLGLKSRMLPRQFPTPWGRAARLDTCGVRRGGHGRTDTAPCADRAEHVSRAKRQALV